MNETQFFIAIAMASVMSLVTVLAGYITAVRSEMAALRSEMAKNHSELLTALAQHEHRITKP